VTLPAPSFKRSVYTEEPRRKDQAVGRGTTSAFATFRLTAARSRAVFGWRIAAAQLFRQRAAFQTGRRAPARWTPPPQPEPPPPLDATMHYFTKQMCQGGQRYGSGVRVGNWNEDMELSETVQKDFLFKKETGTLKLDAHYQRMSAAMQEVELTSKEADGLVHMSDVIQIHSAVSESAIAADLSDRDVRIGEGSCAVTCALPEQSFPCARNTFVLSQYIPNKLNAEDVVYDDDVLRYGMKVRIHMNPAYLGGEEGGEEGRGGYQLFSKIISTTHYAKYSRHQLVGMTGRNNFETVWQVVTPNPDERVVSEGMEVLAGAPVNLLHCMTGQALHLEESIYENDFGKEYEVSAYTAHGRQKKNNCELASTGSIKAMVDKPMTNANVFRLLNQSG